MATTNDNLIPPQQTQGGVGGGGGGVEGNQTITTQHYTEARMLAPNNNNNNNNITNQGGRPSTTYAEINMDWINKNPNKNMVPYMQGMVPGGGGPNPSQGSMVGGPTHPGLSFIFYFIFCFLKCIHSIETMCLETLITKIKFEKKTCHNK